MPSLSTPSFATTTTHSLSLNLHAANPGVADRPVLLQRISGIDVTTAAGQEALAALDIPRLLREDPSRLQTIATSSTEAGALIFEGLASGAYLVTVGDAPDPADSAVFYAPALVAVGVSERGTPNNPLQPKAQRLSIRITASEAEAQPGESVTVTVSASAPNPSADGTISNYALELSWTSGPGTLKIGETTLQEGYDYQRNGTRIVLSESGLATLARLRADDPTLTVTWTSAITMPESTVRLGATLISDGMDAQRSPVSVEADPATIRALPAVKKHFNWWWLAPLGLLPLLPFAVAPPRASTPAPAPEAPSSHAPGRTGEADSPGAAERPGLNGKQDAPEEASKRSGLASTGANVIWLALLALCLILLGAWLRRKGNDE